MSDNARPRLIIASHNRGKIREFQAVLGNHWQVCPQAELGVGDVEETGSTFVENALIKARHACAQTRCAALADDSGLVVPALGGAPGLRSARYSGGDDAANTLETKYGFSFSVEDFPGALLVLEPNERVKRENLRLSQYILNNLLDS